MDTKLLLMASLTAVMFFILLSLILSISSVADASGGSGLLKIGIMFLFSLVVLTIGLYMYSTTIEYYHRRRK